ncbi:MAG: hypothetical protein AAF318_01450 [Pseudomonadota bacterium]
MALKPLGALLAGTLLNSVPAAETAAFQPAPPSRAAPAAAAPPPDEADALAASLDAPKPCNGNCANCPMKAPTPL